MSADGRRWFLVNAPPDVRGAIESFPVLLPSRGVRGTGIEGILLTGADLDQVLGLSVLREGTSIAIHVTPPIRQALARGLLLPSVLDRYAGIEWITPPTAIAPLCGRDGRPSGLRYFAWPLSGKPPRYLPDHGSVSQDMSVAYIIVDEATGGHLLVAPSVAELDSISLRQWQHCDAILFDGTFWDDMELQRLGVATLSAREMGHVPVSGPRGSLATLASLGADRKIYVHVNNTNPMLVEDSEERR